MTKFLLGFSVVVLSAVGAKAQNGPLVGGQVEHFMSCESADGLLGVGFQVAYKTQALPPQYNVVEVKVLRSVVYPGAPVDETILKTSNQDARTVVSESPEYSVTLDKVTSSAILIIANGARFNCEI